MRHKNRNQSGNRQSPNQNQNRNQNPNREQNRGQNQNQGRNPNRRHGQSQNQPPRKDHQPPRHGDSRQQPNQQPKKHGGQPAHGQPQHGQQQGGRRHEHRKGHGHKSQQKPQMGVPHRHTRQDSQEHPRDNRGQRHDRDGRHHEQPSRRHEGRPRHEAPRSPSSAPARPTARHEGKTIEGVLQLKGKSGFLLSEVPGVPDVLVQGESLKLARNGDRVNVRLKPGGDRQMGEIIAVVTRARKTAVGPLRLVNGVWYLAPEEDDFRVRLGDMQGLEPKEGHFGVAAITRWPEKAFEDAQGTLTEVLGPAAAAGVELKTVIRRFELPDAFPDEVMAQADGFGDSVPESALQGRRLFFDDLVVTIDGDDAHDFDDAVSLHPREGAGWRLGVHIADVSHYVTEGSPLDREAFERGTSVYFPGHVVPMLPFQLSNNLCSLRPDVVRLSLTALMDISPEGEVTKCEVMESAIKSARRFTYGEVERLLNGEDVPNVSDRLKADVLEMDRLARVLRARRVARGSLDFDFPEAHITMDPHGRPMDVKKRERLESHRLIEDFMLLANESVARHMSDVPFLYRIHETPDKLKFEKLKSTLDAVGLSLPKDTELTHPKVLQRVMAQINGKPIQPIVQMMVLRSLKQAVYSPANKGHFGLASECYTHFTSPIRRYPDLIVHRIVRERLRGRLTGERKAWWERELTGICAHASKRERVAVDAERDYTALQKVILIGPRLGDTFKATVSSVAAFGFFVELEEIFIEGMIPVATLDDYYVFDEARLRFTGRRTGRKIWMGQKMTVRLAAANTVKRQLEFELLEAEGHGGPSKPREGGHDRPRHGGGTAGRPGDRPGRPHRQGGHGRHRKR